jgi:hypothetical protein
LEICAVEQDTESSKIIILSLHKHLQISINFFLTITEKFNIQQTEIGDAISVLNNSFPGNSPPHPPKKTPITEAEMKSKILNACAFLINHPLSYIENHLLYTSIFLSVLKLQ